MFKRPLLLSMTLLLGTSTPTRLPSTDPEGILGRWRGRSTCVPAAWNSTCHDEEVRYNFVPAASDPTHAMLHASRFVQGRAESMYDIEFSYMPATARWEGDFTNSRVHIRWSYRLRGDSLWGAATILPNLQIARRVVAWRDSASP
jgi:hypothetical protein